MKTNVRLIKSQRKFSVEFKKSLVKEFEKGNLSIIQLSKLHGIAGQQLYDWIYKYSKFNKKGSRIVELKKSSTNKVKELEKRLKELERIVGQKQIKIDYLEAIIDCADEDMQTDLKKTTSIPPLKKSDQKKQ